MIYTSYFAKLKSLPDNVVPISICAKVPNWYKGLQYKKLAPKYDFFMKWKEDHDNDYYIKCFNKQVLEPLSVARIVDEIQVMIPDEIKRKMQVPVSLSRDYHVVLLCYEKPSDFCHRHLVSDWMNSHGVKCEEWTNA